MSRPNFKFLTLTDAEISSQKCILLKCSKIGYFMRLKVVLFFYNLCPRMTLLLKDRVRNWPFFYKCVTLLLKNRVFYATKYRMKYPTPSGVHARSRHCRVFVHSSCSCTSRICRSSRGGLNCSPFEGQCWLHMVT